MHSIYTTKGLLPESELLRTVGVEDRPNTLVLWIKWHLADELVRQESYPLHKETSDVVHTTRGWLKASALKRTIELTENLDDYAVCVTWRVDHEAVRTDINVVTKSPTVVASSSAAGWGG